MVQVYQSVPDGHSSGLLDALIHRSVLRGTALSASCNDRVERSGSHLSPPSAAVAAVLGVPTGGDDEKCLAALLAGDLVAEGGAFLCLNKSLAH